MFKRHPRFHRVPPGNIGSGPFPFFELLELLMFSSFKKTLVFGEIAFKVTPVFHSFLLCHINIALRIFVPGDELRFASFLGLSIFLALFSLFLPRGDFFGFFRISVGFTASSIFRFLFLSFFVSFFSQLFVAGFLIRSSGVKAPTFSLSFSFLSFPFYSV